MEKGRNCYVCGSEMVAFHKEANGFRVFRCESCDLLWVDGVTEQDVDAFYNRIYYESDLQMGYKNYLADGKNHRSNARALIKTVDKIRDLTGLRVLDVGCAHGFLLDEARKLKQCDVSGIEISGHACGYAKDVLGLSVLNCRLRDCDLYSGLFDVAFLIGTVEHLISPKAEIRHIHRILKPDGLLVLTTTDTKGLLPFYAIKPPEHLFYFNHGNLLRLLEDSGYKVLLRKTYFANYHVHDLFYRMGKFSSIKLFELISRQIKKLFPTLSVRIPTNEMIVIAKKIAP
jgi:2-polyprenyl-3-methyl-5-hydroxy-6-metoxy-1,4-benzoquinol methylase